MNNDCIFCKIASGAIPTSALFEDDELIAFRDIRPQAPHHILIIPKRHIETIQDLTDSDQALVGKMILVANRISQEMVIAESGYRLVFNCRNDGGQEVYHIHIHLLGGRKMGWPPG